MEEIWKDIPVGECNYQISNLGRVKKKQHISNFLTKNGNHAHREFPEKIRKLQKSYNKEYLGISIQHKWNFLIHRLVAEAFIENPLNKEFVNHIDGNKLNNHVSNLEWCTRQENEIHAYSTGLKNSTGSKNTMAKLNEDIVKEILKNNDRSLESKTNLSKKYSIHIATIERILNRKIWKHVSL